LRFGAVFGVFKAWAFYYIQTFLSTLSSFFLKICKKITTGFKHFYKVENGGCGDPA